jgi:hypothetical protein
MNPLTEHERRFMDLHLREMHLGQNDGHAHRLSRERGITYDHYLRLEPAYLEYWVGASNWGGPYSPLPDDPTPPYPWASSFQPDKTALSGWKA